MAQAVTPDLLRDYIQRRLHGVARQRVRNRLRDDPRLRVVLLRLRDTASRIRARLEGIGALQPLPTEWLPLVRRAALRIRLRPEPSPVTWLRAGAFPSDERSLSWL